MFFCKRIFLLAILFAVSVVSAQSNKKVKLMLKGQEVEFDADPKVLANFEYDDSAHPMKLYVKDKSLILGIDGERLDPGTMALTWSEEYKQAFREHSAEYQPGQIENVAMRFGKDILVLNKESISQLQYVDNGKGKPLTIFVPARVNLFNHDKTPVTTTTGTTLRTNAEFKENFMAVARPYKLVNEVVQENPPLAVPVPVAVPVAVPVTDVQENHQAEEPVHEVGTKALFATANRPPGDASYEKFDYIHSVKIIRVHGFDPNAVYWVIGENANNGMTYVKKIPNGEIQGIGAHISRNKTIMVPYQHPTRLTKDLITTSNLRIVAGSIVQEVAHDDNSVQVKLTGDPNGTLYTIPKEIFLASIEPVKDEALLRAQAAKLGGSHELRFDTYRVIGKAAGREYPPAYAGEDDKMIRLRGGEQIEIIGDGRGADKNMYLARKKGLPNEEVFLVPEEHITNTSYFHSLQPDAPDEIAERMGFISRVPVAEVPEAPSVVEPRAHEGPIAGVHGLGRFIGDASRNTLSSPECQPWSDYSPKQQSSWRNGRDQYRAAIISAANEHNIDPAVLETSIQVETDFRENVENMSEVDVIIAELKAEAQETMPEETAAEIKAKKSYIASIGYATAKAHVLGNNKKKKLLEQWGKGPAQIGPACAQRLGLKWDVKKPDPFPPSAAYRRDHPNSVYIPEVALNAQAQLFKEEMHKTRPYKDSKGKTWDLRSHMFGRGVAETSRNLLALWNRGESRVMQSYHSYIETSIHKSPPRARVLPDHFGQLWSTRSRKGELVLHGQKINRKHVYYGAGLCGDVDPNSLMARFQKEYQLVNEKWTSIKD